MQFRLKKIKLNRTDISARSFLVQPIKQESQPSLGSFVVVGFLFACLFVVVFGHGQQNSVFNSPENKNWFPECFEANHDFYINSYIEKRFVSPFFCILTGEEKGCLYACKRSLDFARHNWFSPPAPKQDKTTTTTKAYAI